MSRLTFAAPLLLAIASSSLAQQAPAFASNDTGLISAAIFETKDAAALTVGLSPTFARAAQKGRARSPNLVFELRQSPVPRDHSPGGRYDHRPLDALVGPVLRVHAGECGHARRQLRPRRLRLRPDLEARFALRRGSLDQLGLRSEGERLTRLEGFPVGSRGARAAAEAAAPPAEERPKTRTGE